jgi:hypothetical protein
MEGGQNLTCCKRAGVTSKPEPASPSLTGFHRRACRILLTNMPCTSQTDFQCLICILQSEMIDVRLHSIPAPKTCPNMKQGMQKTAQKTAKRRYGSLSEFHLENIADKQPLSSGAQILLPYTAPSEFQPQGNANSFTALLHPGQRLKGHKKRCPRIFQKFQLRECDPQDNRRTGSTAILCSECALLCKVPPRWLLIES